LAGGERRLERKSEEKGMQILSEDTLQKKERKEGKSRFQPLPPLKKQTLSAVKEIGFPGPNMFEKIMKIHAATMGNKALNLYARDKKKGERKGENTLSITVSGIGKKKTWGSPSFSGREKSAAEKRGWVRPRNMDKCFYTKTYFTWWKSGLGGRESTTTSRERTWGGKKHK